MSPQEISPNWCSDHWQSVQTQAIRAGETAPSLKYLPYKHKDLSLNSKTHMGEKKVGIEVNTFNSVLGKMEGRSLGLHWPFSLLGKFQAME